MEARLIDTIIVSFQMRSHSLIDLYRPHLFNISIVVSFQTIGELWEGAELASWGKKKRRIPELTLQEYQVIESDRAICERWAYVRAVRRSRPIGIADAWIAATALACGLELVTHNPKDFAGIPGLTVITESVVE